MKKTMWLGIIISVITLGITAGIIVHVYNDEKIKKATIEQVDEIKEIEKVKDINRTQDNQIVVQTATRDDKTSPNTVVVFETHYNRCGHTKIEKQKIEKSAVNKTEEQIKEIYSEWKVRKFSSDEIELYKEEEDFCDEHYIVKEKDGFIAVYQVNYEGEEKLKKQTEISTQYLPEEDIELLKRGIKANSNVELEQLLTDYE